MKKKIKLLMLWALLVFAPVLSAQEVNRGIHHALDCGTLALPIASGMLCFQTETLGGRTAGRLYVYKGTATGWQDYSVAIFGNSAALAAGLSDETGTGVVVFNTSPTLVTPALGTPASGVLTNATGLPTAGLVDGAVTLAKMANLAQDQFIGRTTASTGVPETATITAAARTVLDDTTVAAMVDTLGGAASLGTGGIVRGTSPTLTTPVIAGGVTQGSGLKHQRVTTGSITQASSAAVTLTWSAAFADANYTVNCSVIEADADALTLKINHIESVSGSAVVVRVQNDDAAAAKTGTLGCIAIHD